MKKYLLILLLATGSIISFSQQAPTYLIDSPYTADPSAHFFNNKIFIYPSHDIQTPVTDGTNGDYYNMVDYHVFSIDSINGKAKDYGIALTLSGIPWASKQLWAPDCAYKNGKYYLYFPAKDSNDIFRIGVAVSKLPQGPFEPNKTPVAGSYSIDPAVFKDTDGSFYMYFGGIGGGQLQQYKNNKYNPAAIAPTGEQKALCPKVARLNSDMVSYAQAPKDIQILDKQGKPLKASDEERRFFEGAWMHKYHGQYYLSYSTGTTHKLCYAISNKPTGPFIFQGEILTPVQGWTTHHSIIQVHNKWYLFYHDTKQSKLDYLRNIKVRSLYYNPDGTIQKMNGED